MDWLNIMPVILYTIFSSFMDHIEDFPFFKFKEFLVSVAMWVLIGNWVLNKLRKSLINQITIRLKNYFDNILTSCSRILLWCYGGKADSKFFYLWMDKTKATHDAQTFLELKVYLARDIEKFVLLCNITLFLLKSSI